MKDLKTKNRKRRQLNPDVIIPKNDIEAEEEEDEDDDEEDTQTQNKTQGKSKGKRQPKPVTKAQGQAPKKTSNKNLPNTLLSNLDGFPSKGVATRAKTQSKKTVNAEYGGVDSKSLEGKGYCQSSKYKTNIPNNVIGVMKCMSESAALDPKEFDLLVREKLISFEKKKGNAPIIQGSEPTERIGEGFPSFSITHHASNKG